MNRLKDTRVYLVGSIQYAKDGGLGWRAEISARLLSFGVKILDPTRKNNELIEDSETHAKFAKLKQEGKWDEIKELGRKIRNFDLMCVDRSDFLIYQLDLDIPSFGSLEEIFWGNRLKKPVLINCKQGKSEVPLWLHWALRHEMFFNNWEELFEYLNQIDSGMTDSTNRWKFL